MEENKNINSENKDSKENSKIKSILKNVLIVFAVCFTILLIIQLKQDYEYYSVYDKEDLKEWFSMSDTIMHDMGQAFSCSLVLSLISIPILSIMQFVSKKNIVRILIGIAAVIIFAIVYFILNCEIVF